MSAETPKVKPPKPELELLVVCLEHKRVIGYPDDLDLACDACNDARAPLHERVFERCATDRKAGVAFQRETRRAFRWQRHT